MSRSSFFYFEVVYLVLSFFEECRGFDMSIVRASFEGVIFIEEFVDIIVEVFAYFLISIAFFFHEREYRHFTTGGGRSRL